MKVWLLGQDHFIDRLKIWFDWHRSPISKYCGTVWNLYPLQDINLFEQVQRSFTCKVCLTCNLPYISNKDCLFLFGLERLELRRLRYDLVEMFKIVNHLTDCSIYIVLSFRRNNFDHRFKLAIVIRLFTNTFFVNLITKIWNGIPDCCFNSNVLYLVLEILY